MAKNGVGGYARTVYSEEQLADFAAAGKVGTRARAAEHPDSPAWVLSALAVDPSRAVRQAVAANRATPVESLRVLAADSDRKVRHHVATNRATPAEVLLLLLPDPHWSVRWAVVDHRNADLVVQNAICESPDAVLRGLLAGVQGLDRSISSRLSEDPVPDVRHRLACRTTDPAVMARLLSDESATVRWGVAMNLLATAEQLRVLARDKRWQVRAVLAQQEGLPDDIYELLARDRSEAVRDWVAASGYAPRSVMQLLARDASAEVAGHARRRIELGPVPIHGWARRQLPED